MNFNLNKSIEILERTPASLYSLLNNVSEDWILNNEGGQSWSVFNIIEHLIHCEKDNWIPRTEIILTKSIVVQFEPYDGVSQIKKSKNKTLTDLLNEFIKVRSISIEKLRDLNFSEEQLLKEAIHPELGIVNLSQLLSTWVVHDLDHLAQISRVMAKQYKNEVGPWIHYLKILKA
ncbi:DinB family protein [Flavobacterium sufflavum]|uniref:DinB family protein n=1 Tax=Flavobacterium sufflavum TaxID=1921138 RepID=A0A3S2U4R0_9FLAO|nr:DinB family protein [Flavobacterium sufflavum]RVT75387.1 DinB family protein [Flavobacterium sufflavum]